MLHFPLPHDMAKKLELSQSNQGQFLPRHLDNSFVCEFCAPTDPHHPAQAAHFKSSELFLYWFRYCLCLAFIAGDGKDHFEILSLCSCYIGHSCH